MATHDGDAPLIRWPRLCAVEHPLQPGVRCDDLIDHPGRVHHATITDALSTYTYAWSVRAVLT